MANDPAVSQMVANLNPMNDFIRAQQFASGILSAAEERQVAAQTGVLRSQQILGQLQDNDRNFQLRQQEAIANNAVRGLSAQMQMFKFKALLGEAENKSKAWAAFSGVKDKNQFQEWFSKYGQYADKTQLSYGENQGWFDGKQVKRLGTEMTAEQLNDYKMSNPDLKSLSTTPLPNGNIFVSTGYIGTVPQSVTARSKVASAKGLISVVPKQIESLNSQISALEASRSKQALNPQALSGLISERNKLERQLAEAQSIVSEIGGTDATIQPPPLSTEELATDFLKPGASLKTR